MTVLLALTGAGWIGSVPVPALTPVAVAVTGLLALDVVALLVSARRRAVRRACADRARRERERRRAAGRRHPTGGEAAPSSGQADAGTTASDVAHQPGEDEPAVGRVRESIEPGAVWTPVPVPPPTYTLKPMAPRAEPAPLSTPTEPSPTERPSGVAEPVARTPRPWDPDRTFADDLDLDAVLARRRAVNG